MALEERNLYKDEMLCLAAAASQWSCSLCISNSKRHSLIFVLCIRTCSVVFHSDEPAHFFSSRHCTVCAFLCMRHCSFCSRAVFFITIYEKKLTIIVCVHQQNVGMFLISLCLT